MWSHDVLRSDFGLARRIDADVYMQKSDSKIPVKWYVRRT